MLTSVRNRVLVAVAFCTASVLVYLPAVAGATETKTKVTEVATKVGDEGVEIVLAILAALVGLLVAIIIIPKAIGLIKRFI